MVCMVVRWEARRRGFSTSALLTVHTRPRSRGSMGPRYYLIFNTGRQRLLTHNTRANFAKVVIFLQFSFLCGLVCPGHLEKNELNSDPHFKAVWICECFTCRKIRLLEGNAKYRHLKKVTCKGTLRQVFICLKPRIPYPPLHNVYVYTVYIFTQGGGERVEPDRRGEGQQFTKLGRNNKND